MNNKSMKLILIAIIILIIIIIGVLILIRKVNKNSIKDVIEYEGEITINNSLERVSIRSDYYIVKNIVERYYSNLCYLNNASKDFQNFEEDEESQLSSDEITDLINKEIENTKKAIYSYFDTDFINETELSTNNLQNKLGNYNDLYVLIENMYVREISGYIKVYFVFGTITEKQTLEKQNFDLMLLLDEKNKTFNIYTSNYIKEHNLYELIKKEKFDINTNEVENRLYNRYSYKFVDQETYASDLLKSYTQSITYNNFEFSYNRLHENYKENRFKEIEDYKQYIADNKKEITSSLLKYFSVDDYGEYTQYTCIDNYGNYYIFNETSIMNYTIILDSYTVDLPEFTSKYETATTEEKVGLNIQKIVEALNGRDYNYVYNKLADEFKANYFKTYEEFKKYAENTFDIGNEVTFMNYTESDELCTYKITLKGKSKTIIKTIVMRLDEGTNFVMSFNVN